jgi:hypothetical protein
MCCCVMRKCWSNTCWQGFAVKPCQSYLLLPVGAVLANAASMTLISLIQPTRA